MMELLTLYYKYGGSQFQNPEVFPSHKTIYVLTVLHLCIMTWKISSIFSTVTARIPYNYLPLDLTCLFEFSTHPNSIISVS